MNNEHFLIDDNSLEVYNMMDKKLIGSDLILALLSNSPVKGDNTKMHTFVFLVWKEIFYNVSFDPVFFASTSGPFSDVIDESLNILHNKQQIEIGRDINNNTFTITGIGNDKIRTKLSNIGITLQLEELKNKKPEWDKWSIPVILEYIRTNYPEYVAESSTTWHYEDTTTSSFTTESEEVRRNDKDNISRATKKRR
jgi:hypothetical protein